MRYLVEQTIHGWNEAYEEAGTEVLELERTMRAHGWHVRHTEFELTDKPYKLSADSMERLRTYLDPHGMGWTLEVFRWET